MTPIVEPELSFLPFSCECGARTATAGDLALHKREICHRRFDRNHRQPSIFSFELPGGLGISDGGRKT
jgi:hypothetical protein